MRLLGDGRGSFLKKGALQLNFGEKAVIPREMAQSCLTLCNLMYYIACQAPLSMEFSRQVY